jgi:hypothetical protein
METDSVISQAEYEIYTAVCQETELFLFHNLDTVFNHHTGDNPAQKRNENLPRFYGAFRYYCLRHKCQGMTEDYDAKNLLEWQLEKKFEVENGYHLTSEIKSSDSKTNRRIFTLSRVGFSDSKDYGLVHVDYQSSRGYYLLFHNNGGTWEKEIQMMSYVI